MNTVLIIKAICSIINAIPVESGERLTKKGMKGKIIFSKEEVDRSATRLMVYHINGRGSFLQNMILDSS